MLTIHLNQYDIPVGADFSLRLSWKNPACYFDQIPGSSGLGIDIPVNDYSRTFFGNPERFEKHSSGSDRKFPGFEIRFGGVLLMSGTLNITNADQEKYTGWLQSEIGVLGEKERDRLISDMPWDKDGERTFIRKQYYDDSEDDYCTWPVLNGAFWNGKGRETTVKKEYKDEDGEVHKANDTITYLTQRFRENFARIVNKFEESGYVDTKGLKGDGEACVVSPFLYLRPFLKLLMKINHFYIDRNDMVPQSQPDLNLEKFLAVYNNYNIMGQVITTEQQVITGIVYDEEFIDRVEEVITGTRWELEPFLYADLVPPVALKDLLVGLQNYLNYVFVFKNLSRVDIIDRNRILKGEAFDLDPYFLGTWIIGERKEVTLKFINEFDGEDRMFGQEYHDLTGRWKDFKDPVETFSELIETESPAIGELRLVRSENRVYEYKWKVVTSEDILKRETQLDCMGWEFVSSGPQPYLYGDSEEIEEIKSCFSTLQMYDGTIMDLPVALQQGNLKKMKSAFVSFTPRLINTNIIVSNSQLHWEGEYGLFNRKWKNWARFWKNRLPVEGSFALPLNVISYIINNITRKYSTMNGEFIIDTIETEFSSNLIGNTRIKGYKV